MSRNTLFQIFSCKSDAVCQCSPLLLADLLGIAMKFTILDQHQLLDSRSEFCCTLGFKVDQNMYVVPFSCWLLIFWKQFSSPDLKIILNFWIRTPTQGNWSRGGGGRGECKNCREMEFLGRREQIKPRWKCIEVRSNSSIQAEKQEFSVVTNRETHEYGFPKYRNTEIQESECGSGAGWLGNTETRNVWQPLVLPPPPNTQIHSFYHHPKIHKYRNTQIHMQLIKENLQFVNLLSNQIQILPTMSNDEAQ